MDPTGPPMALEEADADADAAAAAAADAVELLPRLFAAAAAAAVAGCVGASSWLSPLLPLPELTSSAKFVANISKHQSVFGNRVPWKRMLDSIHLPSVASEPVRNRWPGFEESFYYDLIGPLLDTSGPSIGTASSDCL